MVYDFAAFLFSSPPPPPRESKTIFIFHTSPEFVAGTIEWELEIITRWSWENLKKKKKVTIIFYIL